MEIVELIRLHLEYVTRYGCSKALGNIYVLANGLSNLDLDQSRFTKKGPYLSSFTEITSMEQFNLEMDKINNE